MQNIFAHTEQGSLLPEHSQDLPRTNSPTRIILGDVCGDSADKGAEGIERT